MKIAFNPSTVAALITPPNNKDITFDLRGRNIFARGVKFLGTDTWRDIKINNVSIGSNILDLRNGSNTTLTNTNGVVTINSTWRPVVDNLTSNSTTSSLSANQGRVLKSLIDGKSNSGHTHDDRYLRLTGGTMASNALITFADSGSWGTDKGPQGARGGLYWTGQSDYAKLYAEETVGDNLDLVIQFGDDNSNGLSIRNKANTQTSYISAGGVITTGTFKGNLDWSYITNKPSSYTPSAHTHAWNSLTHSSTTENQAILTNGKANGWKLYTLNISRWDNAANNAHSHANKSVLDGITSALVNNWNVAYTFVNTITGTDTDKVINKWDEIVNFLAGITEDNKLNTLLNSKLSVYKLADNTNVGAIKNNGIYYSTSDASSGTLTNSPFNTGFTLINMTSLDNGDDLRRSRLAFNAYGEIKVSDDRDLANTAETWYNVLTSKNSGISGSTIKLNGTSITVYSSSTADGRYVKKSGDTMTGALNFKNGTWNLVGDDSYMGDCNVSGHFGIKAANTTYPGIAFFNNANAHLGNLTAYNGNIKYGAYSLRFLDNGNTSVSASTWTNPFSSYNSNAVADGQAICVWGQSSSLSNLAADSGDMSLWLKRINANAATLNMVLDGEYYANGNLRLAHVSEIPNSLKNPYSLTTFGVVYDGSAAKTVTTSTFISLVTEGTSTITDGTMFITSYASNSGFADTNAVNVPYKRKAIHLWEYIKAKTDSLYTTKSHNHDDRYVRAFGTSNDNIDSDWGLSFKTFDPIPSGTPPEKNPNISILNIGNNFNRRKLLAFIYSNDNIYYRRHVDGSFTNWRRLAFANEIPTSLKNPHALTISLNGTSLGPYDGSAAKNINITPSSIGASSSSHTHAYLPLSGGTMTGNIKYIEKGTSYIGNGENDAANGVGGTLNNLVISSWYGISFTTSCSGYTYTNKNAVSINCRNGYVYANTFVGTFNGNASTATKLTSSAGNAALPIYFSDGKPVACTASLIFSNLSNSGNNLSITVAGQNRTLTVGYAASAGYANGIANKGLLDSQEKIDNFITANRFEYATFKTTESNNVGFDANDGMILSIPWDSTKYGAQIAFDDALSATVKVRSKSISWGNWYTLLHSGNYNSYSPTLTGTGASGTWGINITGNADTVDSYHISDESRQVYKNYYTVDSPAGAWILIKFPAWNGYNEIVTISGHGDNRGAYCVVHCGSRNQGIWGYQSDYNGKVVDRIRWKEVDSGKFALVVLISGGITNLSIKSTNSLEISKTTEDTNAFTITSNFFSSSGVFHGNVDWDKIIGKPSSFIPSAHDHNYVLDIANNNHTTFAYSKPGISKDSITWLAVWNGYELRAMNKNLIALSGHTHTVFNNNLMIKGTNGISDSASIHLGIGDSDTGFKWISDGKCLIYANNTAVGEWTQNGMNWFINPTVNGNKIWNAGNDGSGSGLDADTVDGEHASNFSYTHQSSFDFSKGKSGRIVTFDQSDTDYGWINGFASTHNNYLTSIIFNTHRTANWYVGYIETDFSTGKTKGLTAVKQLAFLDSNVASATKLQTARTIWGQSFDGTANISGTLSGVAHIQFSADKAYDIGSNSASSRYIYTYWLGAKSGLKLELGANNSGYGLGLCIDTNLNVGIGTNTPAYKLDVRGDIYTTTGFKKNGSSDSYVLLGGGGHKLESSLRVAYASNADMVDGYHATDGRTFTGNINWSNNWNDAWSDGTNKHPWYGFDHRYPNTGAYSTTISDFFGMTIKTALTLRLDFGTLLLNGTSIYSINVASATKLQTPRTIWGQSFDGTADVNGTIYINNNNSSEGAIRLNNNINSNARISAISDQVIFNTGNAIRFGETTWDWNQWAGLKYTHSNKTIYLGLADGSVFNANSALSGGSLRFPGISNVYATTFNGSLSGNASTATNADKIDGVHLNGIFTAFGNNAHNITATIGGVTKSFLVNWAADSDKLDGYHENSFLRYRETTSIDLENTLWDLIGIKLYNGALPDNLTNVYNYGSVISLPCTSTRFEIYASELASLGNGLYYRSGWRDTKRPWLKFIDSSNIGSQSVNYANSAGNADKLDGIHANGLLTALSNSDKGISITVGGTTKSVSNISVNYASSAGSATKVIVNLHTTNDTNYPLVWSNLANSSTITENQLYKSWSDLYYNPKNKRLTVGGSVVASSFVKRGGTSLQLLRADGGIAAFNWSGQSGLPSWLWGGNNEHSYYVYNPSNFRVAYATSAGSADTALYLRSLGNLNCQTGRTLNYGDVYTYNTYDGNTGSPTTFTSVIGFGRGIAGTVEIAGGWDNTNLYWRSLRDCCEDWHSWRTVLDSSNYTEFINNYYWANVKISASSSTTTSPIVLNLTALSSIKMGNIYLLNTDEINNSANGSIYLNYRNSGNVSLCLGGGSVGIGTTTPSYKLDVNGLMRASGFHHSSIDSDNYILLAGGGYSQGVPVKYWSIESISIYGPTSVSRTNRGGNYTFVTKVEPRIKGSCSLTLQFPSGYNNKNTIIWAMGVLNDDISDSDNSAIYATMLQFSGSKYYLNLSDDDSLNNGTCQLYFMCF